MSTYENSRAHGADMEEENEGINIKDLVYLCISHWYWFAISLALCLGYAYWQLLKMPNEYSRSAQIIIKTDGWSDSYANGVSDFGNFDLFKTRVNLDTEIATFSSPDLIREVVNRLHLDMNYYIPGRFHNYVAYGSQLPYTAVIEGLGENESVSFRMDIAPDGKVTLTDFGCAKIEKSENAEAEKARVIAVEPNKSTETPVGNVTLIPNSAYVAPEAGDDDSAPETITFLVSRSGMKSAIGEYIGKLSVGRAEDDSNIVEISATDQSPKRAEDFINTVLAVYNQNWVDDRNKIAVSTSNFINERLTVIEGELGNVESDISKYKSEHLLPDVAAASSMYMKQAQEATSVIRDLENQIYLANYVRDYLTSPSRKNELLPVNSGFEGGTALASQINIYNQQMTERNTLVSNSSEENPIVVDLDASLKSMRQSIINSIDNQITSLNAKIKSQRKYEGQAVSQLASNPQQAKYLLSVERQQKVKESLYLYLLQKREENELSQAFTAYNTRLVTQPQGSDSPTGPNRRRYLIFAFVIGIAIPLGIIFVTEVLNTKVRGRIDLDKLSAPFLGEVPLSEDIKHKWLRRFIPAKIKGEGNRVVIKKDNRNVINEAFRVLRTNLDLVMSKAPDQKVIAVTSFNPGSGKSFVTMNLAVTLAIRGRRVAVIDGDLRHGSMSTYVGSPKKGLADFLRGKIENVDEIAVQYPGHPTLEIIPAGKMPPNPTELLEDDRLALLVEKLRKDYDYVFIDCPPLDIVADTQIIERVTDRTIFIVRAGMLERSMLKELENIYAKKKLKNLAVVLNGTSAGNGLYGNKYGYHYGYYGSNGSSYYSNEK